MTPEFDLIAKYFTRPTMRAVLGVGDDCALIKMADGCELAISTDTLVAGTHFFADAEAEKLGHKALAVNLSDLAAMGATPRYVTLALTLPSVDDAWLASFARGFFALADVHGVELIGGDTTRGPLSITLTVFGEVVAGSALRRDGARAGDDIWVSGNLGGATLALMHMQSNVALEEGAFDRAAERLHLPVPRIALGQALCGVATAAIDISDGLLADLGHICERSQLGAAIEWARVPLSPTLQSVGQEMRIACALSGGDDYELCFTASPANRPRVEAAGKAAGKAGGVPVTRVGAMGGSKAGVIVHDEQGRVMEISAAGFDHFSK
jgi:thiamine-monophosphate kinase